MAPGIINDYQCRPFYQRSAERRYRIGDYLGALNSGINVFTRRFLRLVFRHEYP